MGGSVDSSAEAWAGATLAAAEAYAIENDPIANRPPDVVLTVTQGPAEVTLDGVDPTPAQEVGSPASPTKGGSAAPVTSGASSKGGGSDWVPVAPEDAKGMMEAGGYNLRQDAQGNWEVNSTGVDQVQVTQPATPPPPPSGSSVPGFDYGSTSSSSSSSNDGTPVTGESTGPETPPTVPQEPGLEPSMVQLDDILLGGFSIAKAILMGAGKFLAKKAGQALVEEGVEQVTAHSAASGLRLGKQLATEAGSAELLSGGGTVIAGAGSEVTLRDAPRLVAEWGGEAKDWAKLSSEANKFPDGSLVEVHGYRNVPTGQTVELKTKVGQWTP
jgi:hypothetical protein